MILFRNLITSVTSAWYLKPSMRYRPTGRKTGGGDDTGFELLLAMIYSQAWYIENTRGRRARSASSSTPASPTTPPTGSTPGSPMGCSSPSTGCATSSPARAPRSRTRCG